MVGSKSLKQVCCIGPLLLSTYSRNDDFFSFTIPMNNAHIYVYYAQPDLVDPGNIQASMTSCLSLSLMYAVGSLSMGGSSLRTLAGYRRPRWESNLRLKNLRNIRKMNRKHSKLKLPPRQLTLWAIFTFKSILCINFVFSVLFKCPLRSL